MNRELKTLLQVSSGLVAALSGCEELITGCLGIKGRLTDDDERDELEAAIEALRDARGVLARMYGRFDFHPTDDDLWTA